MYPMFNLKCLFFIGKLWRLGKGAIKVAGVGSAYQEPIICSTELYSNSNQIIFKII